MDQGWASAPDWADRKSAAREVLEEAKRAGRDVLFWPMANGRETPPTVSAGAAMQVLENLRPAPWAPDHAGVLAALEADDTGRSEEHTSELQSRGQLVCRLLL